MIHFRPNIGSQNAALDKLKARHEEVVRHEQAHYDAAGELAASGPVLTDWVEGPDGQRYATGGHVKINTSETGNPEEDLRRGEIIVKAAEAPESVDSELSQADRDVAAKGRRMIEKNRVKVDQFNRLKQSLGITDPNMSRQRFGDMLAGMGLSIDPGKVLSTVA